MMLKIGPAEGTLANVERDAVDDYSEWQYEGKVRTRREPRHTLFCVGCESFCQASLSLTAICEPWFWTPLFCINMGAGEHGTEDTSGTIVICCILNVIVIYSDREQTNSDSSRECAVLFSCR